MLCWPRTTERGSHRWVLRARTWARKGILPELSLLCLFVGRSATNPPPFPPPPLFPPKSFGTLKPAIKERLPGQLAVCFQWSFEAGYVVRCDISKATAGLRTRSAN